MSGTELALLVMMLVLAGSLGYKLGSGIERARREQEHFNLRPHSSRRVNVRAIRRGPAEFRFVDDDEGVTDAT